MRLLLNISYMLRDFYNTFGLLPSVLFFLFILTVFIFIVFEIVKVLLPFTYVAF